MRLSLFWYILKIAGLVCSFSLHFILNLDLGNVPLLSFVGETHIKRSFSLSFCSLLITFLIRIWFIVATRLWLSLSGQREDYVSHDRGFEVVMYLVSSFFCTVPYEIPAKRGLSEFYLPALIYFWYPTWLGGGWWYREFPIAKYSARILFMFPSTIFSRKRVYPLYRVSTWTHCKTC